MHNAERSALVFERALARQAAVKNALNAAKGAGVVSLLFSAVGLATELAEIEKNGDWLSKEERAKAEGGAWGQSLGNVGGAALGGFLGTLVLPGVGTAIGAYVFSQLFGAAGRRAGESLGVPVEKWKEENAEKTRQKGHYEFRGENGTPVWVEPDGSAISPYGGKWEPDGNGVPRWVETVPEKSSMAWEKAWEIPASVLPPEVSGYFETPPEAKLTGSVDINVTVKDERTVTSVKSSSPLFKPTETNKGNAFDARDISP
jgi:hypothetical protein